MPTGVMSCQLNGIPVANGVVNRFDSVMTILCGLPAEPFTSRNASAPAPPDLLITTSERSISSCFWMMPWIIRAIWSAPPPVPAGTMNSTFLVGCQASATAGRAASAATDDSASNRAALTSHPGIANSLIFCAHIHEHGSRALRAKLRLKYH